MIYSNLDILQRLKATLPLRWFGQETPVLDALLTSLSAGWASLFDLLAYTRAQTRISTTFDFWLDAVAKDFFGDRLIRRSQEDDVSFRLRVRSELLRDRCTRQAVYDLLHDVTGRVPAIFEPANPRDTGCYGSLTFGVMGSAGYGITGGWGSLDLPFQVFIKAFRPTAPGVSFVNAWGGDIGAYGTGVSAYITLDMNSSQANDAELYQSVCRIAPIGSIVWMLIEP